MLALLCAALIGCAHKPVWGFDCQTRSAADDFFSRDGTLLAWYFCELPRLETECDVPDAEPPPEKTTACDAFNREMTARQALFIESYHELEQLAVGAYDGEGEWRPMGQRLAVTEIWQSKRLLSVRADGYADWGGAHPIPFSETWCFDLESGAFVSVWEMTGRHGELRAALAEALTEQVEKTPDRFFPDAAQNAEETLEDAAVFFDGEGVHLIFPVYTLAPYHARLPELTLEYESIRPYLNEYGAKLLEAEGE
ncbi:MAG: DUF3298 domain-containing protein [Oscillospiraceae bacterium]|nr:DUF3298 domain-containing protein [Oscillospiraceae bacterium]